MSYPFQPDEPINSAQEIADAVTGFWRLRNTPGGGVGSVFPPRTQAGASIPNASGVKVAAFATAAGITTATLRWFEPDAPDVAGYNVYKRVSGGVPQLLTASRSPATLAFTDAPATVALVVQTVLRNGQTALLDACPSATCF